MKASRTVNGLIGRCIKRIGGPYYGARIFSFCHSNNLDVGGRLCLGSRREAM
jgi:hypothetical protein